MRFSEIIRLASLGSPIKVLGDAEVSDLTIDSRACKVGSLFVCMPGMTTESESFLANARDYGAVAAVVHSESGLREASTLGMAVARLPTEGIAFSAVVARICDVFFEHPTRGMKLIGVTGTNGKTTVAWLMRDMLCALGISAGYLGTLGFQVNGVERPLSNTTPFAVELYGLLSDARTVSVEAMAIEVSSHALAQRRVDGLEFDAAVFTNLTQDHLDFHQTMAEYAAAKFRLFSELPSGSKKTFTAAFNVNDHTGAAWYRRLKDAGARALSFGVGGAGHDVEIEPLEVTVDHIHARIAFEATLEDPALKAEVVVPIGGIYNVENAVAAAAGLRAMGIPAEKIVESLGQVRPVPGRFESVPNDRGIGILVDYAHTPDALEKLLQSVRALRPQRILTVFGCGGDRDTTKRPLMGRVASLGSELTIVTSDNPRTEDPQAIIDQVKAGVASDRQSIEFIDRGEAIRYAVGSAKQGDVVVIAGKGHENYQIIGRTKFAMDDRELARDAL